MPVLVFFNGKNKAVSNKTLEHIPQIFPFDESDEYSIRLRENPSSAYFHKERNPWIFLTRDISNQWVIWEIPGEFTWLTLSLLEIHNSWHLKIGDTVVNILRLIIFFNHFWIIFTPLFAVSPSDGKSPAGLLMLLPSLSLSLARLEFVICHHVNQPVLRIWSNLGEIPRTDEQNDVISKIY